MRFNGYTILFKQVKSGYVALSLELNVAAQGVTFEEAKHEIVHAIKEYLQFHSDTGIRSAQLDLETLRTFV